MTAIANTATYESSLSYINIRCFCRFWTGCCRWHKSCNDSVIWVLFVRKTITFSQHDVSSTRE